MRLALAMIVLSALPAALEAQQQPLRFRSRGTLGLSMHLETLRPDVDRFSKALQRDAFIVGQLAAATGELEDFQTTAALEKALRRVRECQKRAVQNPPAAPRTLDALASIEALLVQKLEGGFGIDMAAVKKEILQRTHFIQRDLFVQLEDARRLRDEMAQVQAALFALTDQLDVGTGEALASTIEFFRAGGE